MHAQNLTDGGSILRHGRAWLSWLHLEWAFGPSSFGGVRSLGVSLGVDGEERRVTASLSLLLVAFHLVVPLSRWLADRLPFGYRRERRWSGLTRRFALEIHHGTLWWRFWADDDEWRHDDPWWMARSWDFVEALLGPVEVSDSEIEQGLVDLTFPESSYRAEITVRERTWSRRRAPWGQTRIYADVQIPRGVPIPGKGENAWDCGEDAIYGTGADATSVTDAVPLVIANITAQRERLGGRNWRPRSSAPTPTIEVRP